MIRPPSVPKPHLPSLSLALGLLWLVGCTSAPSAGPQAGAGHSDPPSAGANSADDAAAGLPAAELTPESAVRLAVVNDPGLRAMYEELGVASTEFEAAAWNKPLTPGAEVPGPARAPRGPEAGMSPAADLLDDLLVPVRRHVAREPLAPALARVAQAFLALAADVQTAARTLQARQDVRAQLATLAEVDDAAAELAQRQFDAGHLTPLELSTRQLAAEQAKLELLRTDAALRADREKINRLLGLSGAQLGWAMPAELPVLPAQEPAPDQLETVALAQRLDFAAAQAEAAQAETGFTQYRETHPPPAVSRNAAPARQPVGGSAAAPLAADPAQAELARLNATLRRARDNDAALAATIRSDVRAAAAAVQQARRVAEYREITVLPQRQHLLREAQLNYNATQRDSFGLFDARERELVAERESLEARRDYWLARVQLERVLGGALPSLLRRPVALPIR